MTSRILHHGLDAIRKFHNGRRVWLIRSREKDHGYARQEERDLWLFWTSLEAMDVGRHAYWEANKLESIMDRVADSESGLKQIIELNRRNEMKATDQLKSTILQAVSAYVSDANANRELAIQKIDVIGQQNPELRSFADDAITTVLFRSFDKAA